MARGSAPRRRARSIGCEVRVGRRELPRRRRAAPSAGGAANRAVRSCPSPAAWRRRGPWRSSTRTRARSARPRHPAEARRGPAATVGVVGRASRGAFPTALPRTGRDAPSVVTSTGSGTVDADAAGGDGVGSAAAGAGSSAAGPGSSAGAGSSPVAAGLSVRGPGIVQRGNGARVDDRPPGAAGTRSCHPAKIRSGSSNTCPPKSTALVGLPEDRPLASRLRSSAQPVPRACRLGRP